MVETKVLSPGTVPKMYGDVPQFMAVEHVKTLKGVTADAVVIGMPYDGIATYHGVGLQGLTAAPTLCAAPWDRRPPSTRSCHR